MTNRLLQTLLTRWLALDPESARRTHALLNKTIQFELKGTGVIRHLHFSPTGIRVMNETTAATSPDLIIRATPLALLQMHLSGQHRHENVSVEGDMELATPFLNLFKEMEIDWEEQLSRLTGDIPAHSAGNLLRKLRKSGRYIAEHLEDSLAEYLHEASTVLPGFPPREEIDDFAESVDQLRMACDRLAARIDALKHKLSARKPA